MEKDNLVVRSQLLPLDGMRLILPNTSIAEIINLHNSEPIANAPNWILGRFEWRGVSIPLLSFETSLGASKPKINKRSRISVLNATQNIAELPFYGVLMQGIPRLLTLDSDSIIDAPQQDAYAFVLRNTIIDGNPAIIPDQAKIETEFRKLSIVATDLH